MKFYLNTSIFGGLFDQEFQQPTLQLFDFIENQRTKIIYSNILEKELVAAPKEVSSLATNNLLRIKVEYIDITDEMVKLDQLYIKKGTLTEKSLNDAQHIAIATIAGASAIISWNFKHIANFMKIQQ